MYTSVYNDAAHRLLAELPLHTSHAQTVLSNLFSAVTAAAVTALNSTAVLFSCVQGMINDNTFYT